MADQTIANETLLISFITDEQRDKLISDIERHNSVFDDEVIAYKITDGMYGIKWLRIKGFKSLNAVYAFGHAVGRAGHY